MNILATQYSMTRRVYEVYVAGCKAPHCPGCHNPEGWDFNAGVPALSAFSRLHSEITSAGKMVKAIWVLGGEPLDQNPEELLQLLRLLNSTGRPVWLFTRYELETIPKEVLQHVQTVKTGPYLKDRNSKEEQGVALASDNQKIIRNPFLREQKESL